MVVEEDVCTLEAEEGKRTVNTDILYIKKSQSCNVVNNNSDCSSVAQATSDKGDSGVYCKTEEHPEPVGPAAAYGTRSGRRGRYAYR
ncbi:hypothetical protein EYF80_041815 [Liparis tanakae]|uniref:Uncharacterized protein n=1 Tax=Liparis tanakae TaxID=230148 RepID=A0A4Z2G5X2_9TELE|nr:hypothetical protein EYF80_041815 [Liparis tanakae]